MFYSPDFGFLKNKIEEFKNKFPDAKILKNPLSIEEIAITLLQPTIFNNIDEINNNNDACHNFIIEDFSCTTSDLESLLKQIDRKKVNLLIVKTTYKSSVLKINSKFFDNEELKIEPLNKTTQKKYISKLNEDTNLSATDISLITSKMNKSVLSINALFQDIKIYKLTNEINTEVLNTLLSFHNPEASFFDFFKLYLSSNNAEWIKFLSEKLIKPGDVVSFLRAFSYKLFDFYLFLNQSKKSKNNTGNEENTKEKPKHNLFSFSEYKKIYENYENNIKNYLNYLIYRFVVFTSSFDVNKSIFEIKYFFLINHIENVKNSTKLT